jgi:hypothetical protein
VRTMGRLCQNPQHVTDICQTPAGSSSVYSDEYKQGDICAASPSGCSASS